MLDKRNRLCYPVSLVTMRTYREARSKEQEARSKKREEKSRESRAGSKKPTSKAGISHRINGIRLLLAPATSAKREVQIGDLVSRMLKNTVQGLGRAELQPRRPDALTPSC